MIALNNDLKKIDEKSLVNLARESLVREKIKKIEILKNESSLTVNDEILEGIIQSLRRRREKIRSIMFPVDFH